MSRMQDWTIIERLGSTILSHVDGNVFEIGVGVSTPILKRVADDYGRNLYSFDKVKERCDWARVFGGEVFHGNSLDNLERISDVPMAMGLIDGIHTADTVRKEFNFFLERLSIGGVIFMHDTYRITSPVIEGRDKPLKDLGYSPEEIESMLIGDMHKLRTEIERMDNVQAFTWPYTAMSCGLTMVMKMDPNRPYYEGGS